MKRTQIQLDEQTYQVLREKAHQRGVSMAHVVREALEQYLTGPPKRKLTLADFKFIAYGKSDPDAPTEYGDIVYEEMREKSEEFWRLREPRERGEEE